MDDLLVRLAVAPAMESRPNAKMVPGSKPGRLVHDVARCSQKVSYSETKDMNIEAKFAGREVGYDVPAIPGMSEDEIQTPCLILDLDALERNIRKMGDYARAHNMRTVRTGRCTSPSTCCAQVSPVCARQSVEPPGLCTSDKAEMIARSSGSIRAESAVELTRSEKHHEELSMLGAGGGCRSCDRRLRSLLLAGE
jgi:hypothetical protein